jgi:hypothetical protein
VGPSKVSLEVTARGVKKGWPYRVVRHGEPPGGGPKGCVKQVVAHGSSKGWVHKGG